MIKKIFRQDREGWACGLTICNEIFVGTITSGGSLGHIDMILPATWENRFKAEEYWMANSFAKEIKSNPSETYKDFVIQKTSRGWSLQNLNGQELRICKTKKECKQRIDTQTV